MSEANKSGPLTGIKIVEIQGLGPTPFAAMWLADMGAEVVRIQRPNLKALIPQKVDVLNRGRGFVELDLKSEDGRSKAHALINRADMLIEGMRPGVMERLGLGPDAFATSNPKLVYGRMTGWGQTGPLAQAAGHDINYISITGALHTIGGDAPVPPLNLLGDFGGGGMYLVAGMLASLYAAQTHGKGDVVDAAITDGTAHLMAMIYSMYGSDIWADQREANLLDGGAPFYTVYECACGGHMSVGALEAKFYAEFVTRIGLELTDLPPQMDVEGWPALRAAFAKQFKLKTRDEWTAVLEGTDACCAPVLSLAEAPHHSHNIARQTFRSLKDVLQPEAAPKLTHHTSSASAGEETKALSFDTVLVHWA